MSKYGAVWHWAKLEVDERGGAAASAVQKRLAARFPVKEVRPLNTFVWEI
jgi:hypothetical protein